MKKIVFPIFVMLLFIGCNRTKIIHIYTPDKTRCITVLNKGGIRYIANGEWDKVPNINFIKLDITKIPSLGDCLFICWGNDLNWNMVIPKSKILVSKIDTIKFKFYTSLPIDHRGIPTVKEYSGENCATFDFYSMKLIPDKGAIIKFH